MSEIEEVGTKEKKAKKNWKRKLFVNSIIYAFAVFGVIFFVLLFSLIKMLGSDGTSYKPVPKNAILTLDLNRSFREVRGDDIFADLSGLSTLSYYDLLKTISLATTDENVKAIVADISEIKLGLSQVENLRQAIKLYRESGKKAYAYSTGFGSFGGGTGAYYLASAFDEIWMMPNTEIGITGMNIEVPFFKDVLEKLGVEPEFFTRYEYKNAVASLTSGKMSPEHRQSLTELGESLLGSVLQEISQSRGLAFEDVLKKVDQAPLFAEEGLKDKFIDKIAYRSELLEFLVKEHKAEAFSFDTYAMNYEDNDKAQKLVAYLVIDGVINSGISKNSPFQNDNVVGSKTILEQISDISKNEKIKALIVRVNSPGGSYTASNEIWYALKKLKEDKKIPVVISMGDYAASGGYFIALAGDSVFAEPTTITGSIGVLGGKISLQKMWEKIGISWENVKLGENAGVLSVNQPFSEKEKELFNKSLDNVYVDFTTKVSESRKIKPAKMNGVARGRVWSGSQAKLKNLVDELGGVEASFMKAKELAGLSDAENFGLIYYPKKKTFQEKISEFMGGGLSASEAKMGKTEINRVLFDLGIDIRDLNMLKRMKYDTILTPMKISM